MHKALGLYFIALTAVGLAVRQPSFTWLAPVSLLILLAGVIWLWQAEGHPIRDLGLQRITSWRRNIGWGFFIGLMLPTVLMAVQAIYGWITLAPAPQPVASLVMIVLLAVIKMTFIVAMEELVFRGYFLQRFGFSLRTAFAVLLSSLLWALMHLPSMVGSGLSPILVAIGMVTWTIFGVALCIGFLHNENTLWFPFGLHYGYNMSYSLVGGLVEVTYHAPTWWVGHPAWVPESGFLGLFLAAAILGCVWWGIRHR